MAFFKLKLDQLMDNLCLVCRAESKQNLQKGWKNEFVGEQKVMNARENITNTKRYLLKYSTSRSVSSMSTLSKSMSLGRNTSSVGQQESSDLIFHSKVDFLSVIFRQFGN